MFNKISIIGFMGRDSELRYTPNGKSVLNFSVATNEKWTDSNGQPQERVEWFRCDLWGKRAESLAQYLVKGKQVHVEGRLRTNEFTRQDGTKGFSLNVHVAEITLLGGGTSITKESGESQESDPGYDESNIPF